VVQSLCKAGKFEEAAGAPARHEGFMEKPVEAARTAYDLWAKSHTGKKEWKEATDVYGRGLKEYPGDKHLENNATVTWDSWARTYFGAKNWAEAIKVYEEALKQLPESDLLKKNLEYCKAQAGQ
jgi:tetratricopeptide (TPR) repeat protein